LDDLLAQERADELQGHTVRFADGAERPGVKAGVRRSPTGSGAQHRRQGPNAERMILRVAGVGVQVGGAHESEPSGFREFANIGFLNIA
jgi:hypothetical protein